METVSLQTQISQDGMVRLEIPSHLPPGPAEVVVLIRPVPAQRSPVHWQDYYGLGAEIREEGAQAYVNRLRDE